MYPVSVMGLFCEDVREEKDNRTTLIGILPDNLTLAMATEGVPVGTPMLTKLGVYIRVSFDPDADIAPPSVRIVFPNSPAMELGGAAPDVVAQAKAHAKEKGHILAGIIFRATIGNFPPPQGVVKAEVVIGDATYLAGALNFATPISSSAPQPPA